MCILVCSVRSACSAMLAFSIDILTDSTMSGIMFLLLKREMSDSTRPRSRSIICMRSLMKSDELIID